MSLHAVQPSAAGGAPSVASRAPAADGAAEVAGGAGRNVQVTRSVCLTGGTGSASGRLVEAAAPVPFFCDWLTIRQTHAGADLPAVDAGCVWAATTDGEILWKTVKPVAHEGSYDTHLLVKCDGHTVTVSGNLSRFGRADNLFGFGVLECVERANVILAGYGLPPFTAGVRSELGKRSDVEYGWTGARISRLDLTANFAAGSAEDAHAVLQFLGSQHNGRKNGRVLKSGETVDWGAGSTRQYWKAYIKHLELIKHARKGSPVDQRVIDYCSAAGIVRFEGTIRGKVLTDIGAAFLGDYQRGWAMGQLIRLFDEHAAVLNRAQQATDDVEHLPNHLRLTARDYLAGRDVSATLKRATFYRHRKELLPFGIDIAIRNVKPFTPRVRVIELTRAEVPSWYRLVA